MHALRVFLLIPAGLVFFSSSNAQSVAVAVASNFHGPMKTLARSFESQTDFGVTLISGSTGGLYAQIVNGAPYDLFVAADSERPTRLAAAGLGIAQTQTTIAIGQLVLWSTDAHLIDDKGLDVLRDERIRFLAIANPDLAPFGAAARQALRAMDLWEPWAGRLVYGQNIAQAYAMVATGNAEIGLIAHSQAIADETAGSYLLIPETSYEPIRQDAILLERAVDDAAAISLLEFLSSAEAKAVIRRSGYRIAD
jgi:molybdate transport system substrate-binding protein